MCRWSAMARRRTRRHSPTPTTAHLSGRLLPRSPHRDLPGPWSAPTPRVSIDGAPEAALDRPHHALGERGAARDHGRERAAHPGRLPEARAGGRGVRLVSPAGGGAARGPDAGGLARRRAPLALRLRLALRGERARLRRLPRGQRGVAPPALPATPRPRQRRGHLPLLPPATPRATPAGRHLQRPAAALLYLGPRPRLPP